MYIFSYLWWPSNSKRIKDNYVSGAFDKKNKLFISKLIKFILTINQIYFIILHCVLYIYIYVNIEHLSATLRWLRSHMFTHWQNNCINALYVFICTKYSFCSDEASYNIVNKKLNKTIIQTNK